MINICFYQTEIGKIGIADDNEFITDVVLAGEGEPSNAMIKETPLNKEAAAQIKEYLKGSRKDFDLPLKPEGTDFQLRVWQALLAIPYGETRRYQEIAEQAGNI